MSWLTILGAIKHRQRSEPLIPFFALSTDPLWITTLEGRFRRINPAFTATLGHRESDLLSRGILDLLHPDDRAAAVAAVSGLPHRISTPPIESRFSCACGSYKWLVWSSTPFPARGLVYTVAHDRTRHKLDADALRQAEVRCASILENTTDAIFAVDRDWKLIRVNQQAEHLWMLHRDDLLGRNLWDVFPNAIGGPFFRLYEEVMRTGVPGHLEDFYPYAPLDRWFEVHAFPRSEGLVVHFRDVTDRRLADQKIKQTLQEKEVLLREVHHRVKNNLQVICSMLRLQERQFQDAALQQALRECRERVVAMAMIHDQLHRAKDFSKIDLGDYIRKLAASLFCSYGVNSTNIALSMDLEDIAVGVDTAIPCGLIVNELISNSLRHAFPEGREGRVSLGLHSWPGGRVELTIADDGQGFLTGAHEAGVRSLGLWLVDLLADQIAAAVERSNAAGTHYRFVFQELKSREDESNE
jgi:PAS domain S-box-containing protein